MTCVEQRPGVFSRCGGIFSILIFFNQTLRNEPVQNSFSNLALFSRTTPISANYKGVASYPLARLGSTVSPILPAMLSHAARVAPSDMA
jgi:hypothetical protein